MYQNLAKFVRIRRKEANLTQQQFAEKTGVALTVIHELIRCSFLSSKMKERSSALLAKKLNILKLE